MVKLRRDLRDNLIDVREQDRDIAHSYLDRLWGWHVNLGLILAGLLLLRLVVEFLAARGTGLLAKIKGAAAASSSPTSSASSARR